MSLRRLLVLTLACLALALLAGCGGGGGGGGGGSKSASSSSGGGPSKPPHATDGTSAGGEIVTVEMKNIQFNPATVNVTLGQTVKWVDEEPVTHNVVAKKGASFKSSNFNQGGSFSFTPKKAGTISYVCTLHAPGMAGKLVVSG